MLMGAFCVLLSGNPPASAVPLYEQLYRSLAAEMRAGTLTAGTRMPGKRRLAAELSVSVNTVDTAYQMLAAEGYLTARERSGFTVQEYLALPQGVQPPAAPSAPVAAHPADTAPPVQFDLSTRGVDPGLFPFRTWARLQKELLYSAPELLTPGDARGDAALRQALAEYLAEYRGVQCDPEQLVVGAGLEYLLGLLAPLLPGPAAVETPGYPRARQVLENNGVPCRCLPVDADGLSLTALSASDAAVCCPTGIKPRKKETKMVTVYQIARQIARRFLSASLNFLQCRPSTAAPPAASFCAAETGWGSGTPPPKAAARHRSRSRSRPRWWCRTARR